VLARDCGLSLGRQHAHSPAAAPPAELDLAVHQGEQGVIPAAADSDSGAEVSAVLTHDDLASAHELTAEPLHAEPLGVAGPPFTAGRRALLVCHLGSALLPRTGAGLRGTGLGGTDAGNADLGVLLPVAQAAAVAGLVFVVDHVDLRASGGAHDLSGDLITAEFRRVADDLAVVYDKHGRQRDALADLTRQLVDGQDVVYGRLLLPATAAHDRVHREFSPLCASPREIPSRRRACLTLRCRAIGPVGHLSLSHAPTKQHIRPCG